MKHQMEVSVESPTKATRLRQMYGQDKAPRTRVIKIRPDKRYNFQDEM